MHCKHALQTCNAKNALQKRIAKTHCKNALLKRISKTHCGMRHARKLFFYNCDEKEKFLNNTDTRGIIHNTSISL